MSGVQTPGGGATGPEHSLDPEEQRSLLLLARRAVRARLAGGALPPAKAATPRLGLPRAAFVTLRLGGDLRGCIGILEPAGSLAETVARCAAAAATEDPRFPPVDAAEADDLSIEISALDPPFVVRDPSEIAIGRHGLIVSQGKRRGLLLPQVATEQGWDRETFLQETCRKAGLDPGAWERGAVVEAFTAQVFGEPAGATGPPPASLPRSPGARG